MTDRRAKRVALCEIALNLLSLAMVRATTEVVLYLDILVTTSPYGKNHSEAAERFLPRGLSR